MRGSNTSEVNLGRLSAVNRGGSNSIRTGEREGGEGASGEGDMSVMHRVDEKLQICLEGILVFIRSCINVLLDEFQPLEHIGGRLLISLWGILQIS